MITTPTEYADLNFFWIRNATEEIARAWLDKIVCYAVWHTQYVRDMEITAALRVVKAQRGNHLRLVAQ